MVQVEFSYDQLDHIVAETLKDTLSEIDPGSDLFVSLNKVIAYFSVPGQWAGGLYDEPDTMMCSDTDLDFYQSLDCGYGDDITYTINIQDVPELFIDEEIEL